MHFVSSIVIYRNKCIKNWDFIKDLLNTILPLNHLDPWAEKSKTQAVLPCCLKLS